MASTEPTAKATGIQALMDLAGSLEVSELQRKLTAAHEALEATNEWDSPTARKVEAAMSYLRMALEAAGRQF